MDKGRLSGANLGLLLLLGAVWGVSFMFISLGLRSMSPVLFLALRFDLAGLAVLVVALARGAPLRPRGRAQWTAILLAALLNVILYHVLLFVAQDRGTSAGIAAVIVGLNPVVTTVTSRMFLADERVGWGGLAGLALGLAGVFVLATLKPGGLGSPEGLTEMLVVGAVAAWALGSTLVRKTRHGMDVFAFTAWHMLVGAVILHVLVYPLEGGGRFVADASGIASLLYVALVSSSAGFLVYYTLLERIGPIRSNLVSHVAPVFATVAGFLVLGDAVEIRAILAFALIAGGFALVARPAPAPRSMQPAP